MKKIYSKMKNIFLKIISFKQRQRTSFFSSVNFLPFSNVYLETSNVCPKIQIILKIKRHEMHNLIKKNPGKILNVHNQTKDRIIILN